MTVAAAAVVVLAFALYAAHSWRTMRHRREGERILRAMEAHRRTRELLDPVVARYEHANAIQRALIEQLIEEWIAVGDELARRSDRWRAKLPAARIVERKP